MCRIGDIPVKGNDASRGNAPRWALNLLIFGDVFHWSELMAASVITTFPVVGLFMFIHCRTVEGLAAGSAEG
jgi:ABC-type glycerol-3-phosphate transport system permease component